MSIPNTNGSESTTPIDACCYFGMRTRKEGRCEAMTEDAEKDGWFMALDSSHPNADAYFVCPGCKNTPPLVCPTPLTRFVA